MTCVSVVDRRDTQRWGCGGHNSLQRLTHVSNLIHNFKVAPYHIDEAISPDTSKGNTSLDISRFKRPRTLLDLLTEICKIQQPSNGTIMENKVRWCKKHDYVDLCERTLKVIVL